MSMLTRVDTSLAGKLIIPDNITSIYSYAFQDCSSLTSITIPDSVNNIYNETFYGCSSLISITIPDSVTSIGNGAFHGCSSLTSITIPDSVTNIGNGVFYDCSSLTSITIPDSVTSIGSYTFHGCSSLISITIPDNVTSIGNGAFGACSSLTSITIPDSVTSIGSNAFYNSAIERIANIVPNTYYRIENGVLLDGFDNYDRLYKNGSLFTGIKDGVEFINGIAEYTGEFFSCTIPNVKDYKTEYTIIKFTPDYSQDYYFSRISGDTVISIKTDINDIQIGKYDADDENYITYLLGGTTYYIGIASLSGTGTCSLDVGPHYGGGSSSSNNGSSY